MTSLQGIRASTPRRGVLLVGARESDVRGFIARVARIHDGRVDGCWSLADAAREVGSGEYGVVLFLAPAAEIAKKWHVALLQAPEVAALGDVPEYEAVLLCARGEAESAHRMVCNGVFDDFAVGIPEIEPIRFDLAMRRANRASEMTAEITALRECVTAYRAAARGAHEDVVSEASERAIATAHSDAEGSARRAISSRLDGFRARMTDGLLADAVQVVDAQRLAQHFVALDEREISAEFSRLHESLASSVSAWFDDVGGRIESRCTLAEAAEVEQRPRVFVVEDRVDGSLDVVAILRDCGYDPILVEGNPDDLAPVARKLRPRALVMSFEARVDEGLECMRAIKRHGDLGALPVVVITPQATGAAVERARDEGAAGFVTTPIDPMILLEKLERAVTRILETPAGDPVAHPDARVAAAPG